MKPFGFARLSLCLGVVLSVREASAVDVRLSGDAYVSSAHASVKYGGLSNLYIGNGNTTYLQFDLSSLPASTLPTQVTHATLTLFVNRVYTAGSVSVSSVTGVLDEDNVTFGTAPAIGSSIGSVPVASPGQFISLDVTAQVQAYLALATGNAGFALASSTAVALFDSKENDETAHAARLDVTLADQGIQGPQGAQGIPGAPGAAGAQGPAGVSGSPGVAGPQGATGAIGPQGPPVNFRGAWLNATTYAIGDTIFYNGSSYISLINGNTNNQPDTSTIQWSLLAQQGIQGIQGSQGVVGAAGPIGPIGATGSTGSTGAIGPVGPTGPQGVAGEVGPQGVTGAVGPQGTTGTTGPQGPPINFRGTWSGVAVYAIGDTVFYNGSSYISLTAGNTNNQPDTSLAQWSLLAQQGTAGATGATGPVGPQGPQGIQGIQGVTGSTGPTGPTGATGAVGPQGPPINFQGAWNIATTYVIGDVTTFSGSSYISLAANNLGFQPDISNTKWSVLAQMGATGTAGATGAAGPTGPSGPTGPIGPTGATGATGGGSNSVTFLSTFVNPTVNTTLFQSPASTVGIGTAQTSISSATTSNFVTMPIACTMLALNVGANNYFTTGADTETIIVYKNSIATTMTCSVTTNGNGSSCTDTTNTFSVVAGDTVSLGFSQTNNAPFNKVSVKLFCQ